MRGLRCIAASLLLGAASSAGAFEQTFEAPAFVVSIPGLPNFGLTPVRATEPQGSVVASGRGGPYLVEITASASTQAGSTRTCAGNFLRELLKRPNMPDRDSIYRAPFDASTFLVLYIIEQQGKRVLHAHLLSAASGTHCVDAHVSRDMGRAEDEDNWRTTFTGARVSERRK